MPNYFLFLFKYLKKVNFEILKGHFEHCIKESFNSENEIEQDKKIEERVKILDKLLK